MSKPTRLIAAVVASLVLAALIIPAGAAGGATRQQGSTGTDVQILSVELTRVPALGRLQASLGVAAGDASTVDKPLAGVLLNALRVGGQSLGAHELSSAGGDQSLSVNVPLNAPGIDGSLTVAELRAEATADSALAVLSALEGDIDIGPLGLGATMGEQGLRSSVDPSRAASAAGVDIGPLEVGLGDLLPDALLENLPLSALLKLVKRLDLNVEGRLRNAVEELRELAQTADSAVDTIAELATAQADLDELLNDNAAVQAAKQAVADAAAAVDAAEAVLADTSAELAALEAEVDEVQALLDACVINCALLEAQLNALNSQVDTKQGELAAAQSDLAAAQADLAAAQAALESLLDSIDDAAIEAARALVEQLETTLNNLLDRLTNLIGGLPNLNGLLNDVIAALKGAPLLSVGRLALKVESAADATAGSADVVCGASGVRILGQSVGGASCAALTNSFARLRNGIFGALSALPVAGAVPQVTAGGLTATESVSSTPDAEGYNHSQAALTALQLGVPSVELANVVDDAVADLLASVEDLLGSNQLTDALEGVLTDLQVTLSGLPVGDTLAGLATIGLNLKAGELASNSRFRASGDTNVDGGTQGTPDERGPSAAPTGLPFTGTGSNLLFVFALGVWLAVAGATASFLATQWRVRRTET